ncbi:MAG TPA: branched-chain-amino-acid transaminase [Phycisphaerae bacterium]|nr:branched-chain-amino-acid transaminase [Phycisphaerae bacterium]
MSDNPFAPRPDLKVFLDGQIVPVEQATISVFDHGLLYGDGVFEGIRSYDGRVFELDAHVQRLFDSAKAIRLTIPMSAQQIKDAIHRTLEANGLKDAYIRLVVTRGVGYLGLAPTRTANPSVFVITDQIELYPPELYRDGMSIITVSTVRNHPNAVPPPIKSLNYLNNILAKIEGVDAGVLEAIMLNVDGLVAECTGDNVFIVRQGRLQTPSSDAGILPGITRAVVMRLAAERGIEVQEKQLLRYDLYVADECFLTGTAAEVVPITGIDGRQIGDGKPGPITQQLVEDFKSATRGER